MARKKTVDHGSLSAIFDPEFQTESAEFDRTAYRNYLLSVHEAYLQNPPTATKRHPNPKLDIYSTEYDVDADIDAQLHDADVTPHLLDLMRQIAESFKDPDSQTWNIIIQPSIPNAPDERPRDLAIKQGAIMTLNNRIASPSAKGFENAFTPARIIRWKKVDGTYTIDEETGQYTFFPNAEISDVMKLHGAFLAAIFQLATKVSPEKKSILFYAPAICKEAGIDPRENSKDRKKGDKTMQELRREVIEARISAFEDFMGKGDDGGYYRVLVLNSYDPNSETFDVSSPYIFQLMQELAPLQEIQHHSQVNKLIHANAISERNYAAYEVANLLTTYVLQLGSAGKKATQQVKKRSKSRVTKDGEKFTDTITYDTKDAEPIKYTYHKRYSELIAECPQFKAALDEIRRSDSKNKTAMFNMKLKRILEGAYKIILEDSDLPKMFNNLRINDVGQWAEKEPDAPTKDKYKPKRRRAQNFKIPTKSKLDAVLYITHEGKNPDFSMSDDE